MSGTVGTFAVAPGTKLEEAEVRKLVESKELTFEKMEVAVRGAVAERWTFEVDAVPT